MSVSKAYTIPRPIRARALLRAGLGLALGAQLCLMGPGCGGGPPQSALAPPPGSHAIAAVPFFPDQRQRCGPASLAAVMTFHGQKASPAEIARAAYRPDLQGSLGLDLMLFARGRGLCARWYGGGPGDLARWIGRNQPLVVMVDEGLGPVKKLHFMVVTGYGPRRVLANSGLDQGLSLAWPEFHEAWRRAGFATLRVSRPGGEGCP